jgi:hypothetical protein
VVGNQIHNLIPIPSFDHNSCISYLNEQWEGTWGIHTSRTFQWYPKVPIWCLFTFLTKAMNIHDSRTSATPKVGVHLGVIGFILCTLPHLWKCVSHPNTISWPCGPSHSTFNRKPNVKVVTLSLIKKRGQCFHWHLEFSCFLCIKLLSPSLDLSWTLSFPCNCFLLFHGHQLPTFCGKKLP